MQERFKKFLKRFRIYWVIRRKLYKADLEENSNIIWDIVYNPKILPETIKISGEYATNDKWRYNCMLPEDDEVITKKYKISDSKVYLLDGNCEIVNNPGDWKIGKWNNIYKRKIKI